MMNNTELKKKYLITMGVGIVLTVILLLVYGIFTVKTSKEVFRILSDAFSIPGGLFLIIGGIIWVMNQGGFDGLFYMTRSLFKPKPQRRGEKTTEIEEERVETYAEYIIQKQKKKKVKGYAYIPLCGIGFLLLSAFCIVLFYVV